MLSLFFKTIDDPDEIIPNCPRGASEGCQKGSVGGRWNGICLDASRGSDGF